MHEPSLLTYVLDISRFITVWKIDIICFPRHISNIFNQVGNLFWHIYLVYSGYDYNLRIILHNDILQILLTCFPDGFPNRQPFCNKNLSISNRFAWHLNNLSFTIPASVTDRRGPFVESILDASVQILWEEETIGSYLGPALCTYLTNWYLHYYFLEKAC